MKDFNPWPETCILTTKTVVFTDAPEAEIELITDEDLEEMFAYYGEEQDDSYHQIV